MHSITQTTDPAIINLAELSKLTEDEARAYLERIRWPYGPVCPHCGVVDGATKLEGEAHRPGVYECRSCLKQFTVTVGTIFERSHIELRLWLMAFAIMCASKKDVSAKQLQRQLGLGSYQSAWHMAHRVRHAMSTEPLKGTLAGRIEVDEAYVGGKPRPATMSRANLAVAPRRRLLWRWSSVMAGRACSRSRAWMPRR
jgi:transposase-like protein